MTNAPCDNRHMAQDPMILFSYGTLQQREVQLSEFGRELAGTPDRLPGYELSTVEITDPHVIAISGATRHLILRATGNACDSVAGTALRISADDLMAADAYEVDDNQREIVSLASGLLAWVYAADHTAPSP